MKIAIIGFGGMGAYHPEIFLNKVDGIQVAGVFDIAEDRMKLAEKRGHHLFSSQEELLACKDVDVVVIATPNHLHKPIAIAAMEAGKHVVLEKPATITSKDFEDLVEVSKKTGKFITVHQNRRQDEDYLIIKKTYDENLIGKPFRIESRVQGSNGVPEGWRTTKAWGGGMLLDWGVHLIDQLMMMIDAKVDSVYAIEQRVEGFDCDDSFNLVLHYDNDIYAIVDIGTRFYHPLPRWVMSSQDGGVTVDDWSLTGKMTKAIVRMVEFDQVVFTAAGPTKTMAPRHEKTIEVSELPKATPNPLSFYQNLVEVVNGKAELIVKPEQVLRTLRVIDAAFVSFETGERVKTSI